MLQAIEELQRAGLVLFQAIGNKDLHGLVSNQAIGELQFPKPRFVPKAGRECRFAK